MATNSLQSLHHHHSLLKRHNTDTSSSLSSCIFVKPTTNTTTALTCISSTTTASLSVSSTTSTTPISTCKPISFDQLQQHLSTQDFRQADEETRRLLIALAGDAAVKRGYVFFSEVQFISETDLKAIDELWRQYSDNKFGYSVQNKIWQKVNKDFTNFFIKVGWMKKLDTEVEQFNYRAFPNEFIWELNKDTPVGHLPLTNALRGTQLLKCILSHPAFDDVEEEDNSKEVFMGSKPLRSNKVFKSDYSF